MRYNIYYELHIKFRTNGIVKIILNAWDKIKLNHRRFNLRNYFFNVISFKITVLDMISDLNKLFFVQRNCLCKKKV
jgi:hypothetical protein